MLSLSQTTGYAILALACLEDCQDRLVRAKEIAGCTGIPLPYLSKILHALGKVGIIVTKRGYGGGFALARPAERINLLEVAEAVEGESWLPKCLLGLTSCSDERDCLFHEFWKVERERIRTQLRSVTIRDVARFERSAGRGLRRGVCWESRQKEKETVPTQDLAKTGKQGQSGSQLRKKARLRKTRGRT